MGASGRICPGHKRCSLIPVGLPHWSNQDSSFGLAEPGGVLTADAWDDSSTKYGKLSIINYAGCLFRLEAGSVL